MPSGPRTTLAALLALPPMLCAQTAAKVTEPGRTMHRAVDLCIAPQRQGPRTLFLLLDATPSVAESPFRDELRRALERHRADLAETAIGVARIGRSPLILQPPTGKHADVLAAVDTALQTTTTNIQDVYGEVRNLAAKLKGRKGSHEILLVTFENGDAEHDVEATVKHLQAARARLSVITREAFLADSYWTRRRSYLIDGRRLELPKDTDLTGGDGAFTDLPWQYLFQQTILNEVVPSGFATYGLTRLAVATEGRVFLYSTPGATVHHCTVSGRCLFCPGDHIPTGEAYSSLRLSELAPLATSRRRALEQAAADPYVRAVVTAWHSAAKAGILETSPSIRILGPSAELQRNRGGGYLAFFDSLSFDRHARDADDATEECTRIIGRLEAAMKRAAKSGAAGRSKAIADLTRVNLYIARANLICFAAFCRKDAPRLIEVFGNDPNPPEVPAFDPEREPIRIAFESMCLCHGVRPFLGVRLPGGKTMRRELLMLDHVVTEFLREYHDTPYAVAVHRAGLARFYIVEGAPPGPPGAPSARARKPAPTRGRPDRGPGATTGGAAGGPKTGKRP